MMELVTKTQEREVCEELDMLLGYGGDKPEVGKQKFSKISNHILTLHF
jgi:hypothetical protein